MATKKIDKKGKVIYQKNRSKNAILYNPCNGLWLKNDAKLPPKGFRR
jgi:hypothetical protein